MSLIDCVTKLRNDGKITPKQGEDILRKSKRLQNMYALNEKYSDIDIVTKASKDALDGMLYDIRFAKYQEALSINRLRDARSRLTKDASTENNWIAFGGQKKGLDRAMVDLLRATDASGKAIEAQAVSKMIDVLEQLRSKVAGGIDKTRMFGGKNNELARQMVRGMHGDSVGKEASAFGDMVTEALDFLFDRKLRAGINIHKLENFGVPHKWDATMLKRAGRQAFINDSMQRLDRNRMVAPDGTALDDANLEGVLDNIFNKLTGGPTQSLPMDGEFLSRGGAKSLRSSSEASRVLHFKTGQDWIDMHDKYGTGDIFQNILQGINRDAQDIAIFERFGPDPNKVFNSLQAENRLKNKILESQGQKPVTKTLLGTPAQMWKVLSGTESDLINPRVADTFAALRNFQTSAKLGGAVLSNLTDHAFAKQQLNRWGASYTSYVGRWFGQLRPGNKEDRALAGEMLLGMQWAYDTVISANRYGDVDASGKFSRAGKAAADFTIRASGLSSLNRASRSAAGLELNAHIASNFKSSWDNLDSRIKLGLEQGGIRSGDWNIIRANTVNIKGTRYLDMQKLLAKDERVSTKITSIFQEFIRKAAPEPDLQARAIVTGGGAAKGSFQREATSTLLQFKSFPITVLIQNLRDQMFDPRLAATGTRVADLSNLVIFSSLIGGGVVQLKNIVAGRDLEDPTTLSFFYKSIAQGGSPGVITDVVNLATEPQRSRIAEQLLPPVAAMAIDVTTTLVGGGTAAVNGDYDRVAKLVINAVKSNQPGQLFYTKLAVERLIYDQIEALTRPDVTRDWRRYQRSLERRTGQQQWWRSGDKAPERLPEVAEQR